MSKLLIAEPPLQVLPTLAQYVGLNEAIFLQQLHYLLMQKEQKTTSINGQLWLRQTLTQWQRQFPFWSPTAIKRIKANLCLDGLMETTNQLGSHRDQADWHAILYHNLSTLNHPTQRVAALNGKRAQARAVRNVPVVDNSAVVQNVPVDNLPVVQNVPPVRNVPDTSTKRTHDTSARNVPMYKEEERNSSSSSSNKEEEEELQAAMAAAGIGRNVWKRLAALEWVNVDYINAHAAAAQQANEPVRYVVQRIKSGDAPPKVQDGCPVHGTGYWTDGSCLVCGGVVRM